MSADSHCGVGCIIHTQTTIRQAAGFGRPTRLVTMRTQARLVMLFAVGNASALIGTHPVSFHSVVGGRAKASMSFSYAEHPDAELVTFVFDENGKAKRVAQLDASLFGRVVPTSIVSVSPITMPSITIQRRPFKKLAKAVSTPTQSLLAKLKTKRKIMRLKREGLEAVARRERMQAAYDDLVAPATATGVLDSALDLAVAAPADRIALDALEPSVMSWYDQGIRLVAAHESKEAKDEVAPMTSKVALLKAMANKLRLAWVQIRIGRRILTEDSLAEADVEEGAASREVGNWVRALAARCRAKSAEVWEPITAVSESKAWAAECEKNAASCASVEEYATKKVEIASQVKSAYEAQCVAEAALEAFEEAQTVTDAARAALEAALEKERAALKILVDARSDELSEKDVEAQLRSEGEKLRATLPEPATVAMAHVEWPAIGGKAPHPRAGTM